MLDKNTQRRGLYGVARVAGVLLVTLSISVWWTFGKVHADLSERSLVIGRSLARTSTLHAGTTRLSFNGQPLSLNAQVSQLSVAEVLERFSTRCGQESGGMEQVLERELATRGQTGLGFRELGVFRSAETEPGNEGTIACFASADNDGLAGLMRRLQQTMETGDFSRLGQFRYVFARKLRDDTGTHVVSVWSEGSLNLEQMFPAHGDVPGDDILQGVRPPYAVRVLSARALDTGFQNSTYESTKTPGQVLASYERSLLARGYVVGIPADMYKNLPVSARLFTLGNRDQLIVVAQADQGKTLVSALRVASNGYVEVAQ